VSKKCHRGWENAFLHCNISELKVLVDTEKNKWYRFYRDNVILNFEIRIELSVSDIHY